MNEERKERRDFFTDTALKAAKSLQGRLSMDEYGYRSGAGSSYADARAYYIYGVLNEVIKAGTAMVRWDGLITEPKESEKDETEEEKHIDRLILEAIVDEQHIWMRKLAEILINLICFSQTNEQEYYRAFMAAIKLEAYLGLQRDFQDFYRIKNRNVRYSIDFWLENIQYIGSTISLEDCWFLQDGKGLKAETHPAGVFRSTRHLLRRSLSIAFPGEKIALGHSYEYVISTASRSMHPNIGGSKYPINMGILELKFTRVGLLAIHIVHRSHQLCGLEPTGVAESIAKAFESEESIAPDLLEQEYEIGDLVIAYADLAEIIDTLPSEYGYTSYKVRYLTKPPIEGVDEEDWHIQKNISLVARKSKARDWYQKNLGEDTRFSEIFDEIMTLSDEQLYQAMKRTLTDLDRRGVLIKILKGQYREDD